MRANACGWGSLAIVTFVCSRASFGTIDARSAGTVAISCVACVVSLVGQARIRERQGTGTTRACAAATAVAATCRGAIETWARVTNADEHISASWLWSEGLSAVLERFFGMKTPPGALYPACVNAEVLYELTLALLPLGSYLMCVGIDGQSSKKEN